MLAGGKIGATATEPVDTVLGKPRIEAKEIWMSRTEQLVKLLNQKPPGALCRDSGRNLPFRLDKTPLRTVLVWSRSR